jgi:hypothetical protein
MANTPLLPLRFTGAEHIAAVGLKIGTFSIGAIPIIEV